MEFIHQLQADKNQALADAASLRRQLGGIPAPSWKRSRSPSANSEVGSRKLTKHTTSDEDDDEEDNDQEPTASRSGRNNAEDFADRIGHKFFLIYGPWVHFGRNFFSICLDEDYDGKDRFTDDDSMAQAQLREIMELIQERYTEGVLKQSWFSRTVCSFLPTLHSVL